MPETIKQLSAFPRSLIVSYLDDKFLNISSSVAFKAVQPSLLTILVVSLIIVFLDSIPNACGYNVENGHLRIYYVRSKRLLYISYCQYYARDIQGTPKMPVFYIEDAEIVGILKKMTYGSWPHIAVVGDSAKITIDTGKNTDPSDGTKPGAVRLGGNITSGYYNSVNGVIQLPLDL